MFRRLMLAVVSTALLAGSLAGLVEARPLSTDTPEHAAYRAQPNVPAFADGTVLVGFHEGVSDADVVATLQRVGAARARVIGAVGAPTHVARVPPGLVLATIQALQALPQVRYAEPNYIVQAIATPTDASFGVLWGLHNTGQTVDGVTGTVDADIDAPEAWDITTGSSTIVVGVVDTGVAYGHADLDANIWSNPGGVGGCPAGTHGLDARNNDCDPNDDHNHGTHVAGTIGAEANNGGVVGVNWNVSIMGLKFLSSSGSGTIEDAIEAYGFAIQAKQAGVNIRVLNNSWGGGGFSQGFLDNIDQAGANGILSVFAAGNGNFFGVGYNVDSSPFYPCSYTSSSQLCVAATTQTDAKASFSNYGSTSVDLGAPGVNILSTIRNGSYAYYDGTSMATPHVSGAAALVLSACALTLDQLKAAILNNVDPVSSLAGKTVTGGRLNAHKALSCVPPTPPSAPSALTATAVSSSRIDLTWADNSSNETGFKIERSTDGVSFAEIATVGANVTSYSNTGLDPSATYHYRVRANNAAGDSGYSNTASATTLAAPLPPTAPSGLTATAASSSQIDLAWADNSSNETGFKLERSTDGLVFAEIATVGANVTSYSNTGLAPSATYHYRVRANNAAGDSGYSNTASATTPPTSTGLTSPAANAANGGGDRNGYEVGASSAHANDGVFAIDNNSGTNTSGSCSSSGKDKHNFYNYGFTLPGGAMFLGIEVRLDAKVDSTSDSPKICAQLSWDGGATWTSAKSTTTLTTNEATYILGGSSDTWGRTWTVGDFSNANFRVRVINVASSTSRDFSLDWVAVNVSYQ